MANTAVKDGTGNTVYLESAGSGTVADPYTQIHSYKTVVADATITGIVTITTAGTPVQGGAVTNINGFYLKGNPANTGSVWVFFYGQTKASGFPLASGQAVPLAVTSLAVMGFDADVSGEKICWIKA